ncbi:molybdopterin dinucleotide binding domain-containing protein, partial [Streptomyces fradiae]|uniref:molybdopterin dinucleotide binding domain-containing protein n=1 Tax=Streptomyces fradiae TaxID=1906 RepID=UPI0036A6474A
FGARGGGRGGGGGVSRAPAGHLPPPGGAVYFGAARGRPPPPREGEAVLAGHRMLLDLGRLQEGDEALAGTRHAALARLSPATAAETGVKDGDPLRVTGPGGSVTLPLRVTEMPDRVVWLPLRSTGDGVLSDLGTVPGRLVRIAPAAAPLDPASPLAPASTDTSEVRA